MYAKKHLLISFKLNIMRKLEKFWIGCFAIASIAWICAVVCAICNYEAAIAPGIIVAGIAAYAGLGAKLIYIRRERLGQ